MVLLELIGLRKQFGELVAVDDVNLTIEEGEIRGLIGPNGSGKTTLFNLISGFLRPTRGRVVWQGHDITGLHPHVIAAKGLTRTFQITALLKQFTAIQNALIACHLHTNIGLFRQFLREAATREKEKKLEQKAIGLLETMGIAHVKDEIAGELPHGYQQALGIVCALATEPKLLLLDEPVTGMNPVETREMMDKIKKIRDSGVTICLVEHDMKAVMGTSERVTVMNFGKKIAEGLPKEVSQNKDVIEAYLGGGENYA